MVTRYKGGSYSTGYGSTKRYVTPSHRTPEGTPLQSSGGGSGTSSQVTPVKAAPIVEKRTITSTKTSAKTGIIYQGGVAGMQTTFLPRPGSDVSSGKDDYEYGFMEQYGKPGGDAGYVKKTIYYGARPATAAEKASLSTATGTYSKVKPEMMGGKWEQTSYRLQELLGTKEVGAMRAGQPGRERFYSYLGAATYPFRSPESTAQVGISFAKGVSYGAGLTALGALPGGQVAAAALIVGGAGYAATKIPGLQAELSEMRSYSPQQYRARSAEVLTHIGATYGGAVVGAKAVSTGITSYKTWRYNVRTRIEGNYEWGKEYTTTRPLESYEKQLLSSKTISESTKQEILGRAGGRRQYGIQTQKGIQTQLYPQQFKEPSAARQQTLQIAKYTIKGEGVPEYLGKYTALPKQVRLGYAYPIRKADIQYNLISPATGKSYWGKGSMRVEVPTSKSISKRLGLFASKKGQLSFGKTTFQKPSSKFELWETDYPSNLQTRAVKIKIGKLPGMKPIEEYKLGLPSIPRIKSELGLGALSKARLEPAQIVYPIPKLVQTQVPVTRQVTYPVPDLGFKYPRDGGEGLPRIIVIPGIPTEVPPIIPKVPIPFRLPEGGGYRYKGRVFKINRRTRYQPSLVAKLFRIKGRKPKKITGLEIRPLLRGM